MDKSQIVIYIVVFAFVAFRLYQKYGKKDKNTSGNKASSDSQFTSSGNEDDYEPYSGKEK